MRDLSYYPSKGVTGVTTYLKPLVLLGFLYLGSIGSIDFYRTFLEKNCINTKFDDYTVSYPTAPGTFNAPGSGHYGGFGIEDGSNSKK